MCIDCARTDRTGTLTVTPLELRVAMDALDLNQTSLARTLDVSRRLVVYWAAGARPVPATAAMVLNLMLTTGTTVKDSRI
jgi:DNA-binding transcriptional regulator YiaG